MLSLFTDMPKSAQIEVTTICNYKCFYCAGRQMPQRHMSMIRFEEILEELPISIKRVSLQGEGEPTANPAFFEMVDAVIDRGWTPYTITNGSLLRSRMSSWIADRFPKIGVSIDTLDAALAHKVGRYKLARVLEGVEKLITEMGAGRILIHTVAFGQPLTELREWVELKGFAQHIIQPLQGKEDYLKSYSANLEPSQREYHYNCRFLTDIDMNLYYSLDGKKMPCCYIKDTSQFTSIADLRRQLERREIPHSCRGCGEISRRIQHT